jgi:hypothetical protein
MPLSQSDIYKNIKLFKKDPLYKVFKGILGSIKLNKGDVKLGKNDFNLYDFVGINVNSKNSPFKNGFSKDKEEFKLKLNTLIFDLEQSSPNTLLKQFHVEKLKLVHAQIEAIENLIIAKHNGVANETILEQEELYKQMFYYPTISELHLLSSTSRVVHFAREVQKLPQFTQLSHSGQEIISNLSKIKEISNFVPLKHFSKTISKARAEINSLGIIEPNYGSKEKIQPAKLEKIANSYLAQINKIFNRNWSAKLYSGRNFYVRLSSKILYLPNRTYKTQTAKAKLTHEILVHILRFGRHIFTLPKYQLFEEGLAKVLQFHVMKKSVKLVSHKTIPTILNLLGMKISDIYLLIHISQVLPIALRLNFSSLDRTLRGAMYDHKTGNGIIITKDLIYPLGVLHMLEFERFLESKRNFNIYDGKYDPLVPEQMEYITQKINH